MDDATYRRFTDHLRDWAAGHPDVLGLVALGSMAGGRRKPDEWSDHDFWVVARDEAAPSIRDDPSWLPDPERIVLFFVETDHGRNVVYDDGHLVEQAVFADSELEIARANEYRVLVDKADVSERMARMATLTAREHSAVDDERVFGKFAAQTVIGLTRYGRGEVLSAENMVKDHALGNLLRLLGRSVPPTGQALLDNLDPRRRFEVAYPELGRRIAAALHLPVPEAVTTMIDIAEECLSEMSTAEVLAILRGLVARVDETRR